MKYRSPLLFLLLLLTCIAFAQGPKNAAQILAQPHEEIDLIDTSGFGLFELPIRFPYGSARILNTSDYQAIKDYGKYSVDYIYTQYTRSQPGQKQLDLDRFAALKRMAPDLFNDPDIEWNIVVQTSAQTPEAARALYHGFIIRYQPPWTEERKTVVREELDLALECARKCPPADAPKFSGGPEAIKAWVDKNIRFPKEELSAKGSSRIVVVEFKVDTLSGKPTSIRVVKGVSLKHNEHIKAMIAKMEGWSKGNPAIEFSLAIQFSTDDDGVAKIEPQPLRGYNPADCASVSTDSTITKVFERNKTWKKMLVVEDVTGSMMPYISDLLLWNALKGNLQSTRHFVFFNDGDLKDDIEKVIGSTGGIYHAKPDKVEMLEETMISAVAGGEGGDSPENDIEAVLEGIKKCPDCEEVVLISDNAATPRDLELVPRITKPVHVILCGVRYSVNPAHLYIAWKTKGSVHTINQDITKLAEMEEGQTITVMGKTYKILKGKFVPLGRM